MEENAGQFSGDLSAGKDHYSLKHLNKLSHKISKPTIIRKPGFDPNPYPDPDPNPGPESDLRHQPPPSTETSNYNNTGLHQHQPPVYNINKDDFRDVVQRLTGTTAYDRADPSSSSSTAAPLPRLQSSRLHRIRPPPLAQVSNRPPTLLNYAERVTNPSNASIAAAGFFQRPYASPLSPLPPLPAVHAAAESPISAYMRYLQNSLAANSSNPIQLSPFSPRWHQTTNSTSPPPSEDRNIPAPENIPLTVPFGCLGSPRSQLYAPLLPPVPSPKYRTL